MDRCLGKEMGNNPGSAHKSHWKRNEFDIWVIFGNKTLSTSDFTSFGNEVNLGFFNSAT